MASLFLILLTKAWWLKQKPWSFALLCFILFFPPQQTPCWWTGPKGLRTDQNMFHQIVGQSKLPSFFKLTNSKLWENNSSDLKKKKQPSRTDRMSRLHEFPLCFAEGLSLCVSSARLCFLAHNQHLSQLLMLSVMFDFSTATCCLRKQADQEP